MKVIKIGDILQINSGDDIDIQDSIPVGTYSIAFAKNRGFFLVEHQPLEIKERIYGQHTKKAEKVLRSFEKFDRNLGVILSGPKGIGKSIFARQVCILSNVRGYPVIIVDQYISGIADFIASIDQECVFLFDEFEKTFAKHEDDRTSPQEQLLPLFDGVEGGKRLFIVTCNETGQLNSYLVNRPGRFHYHFRFDYPDKEEVKEYMQDHLDEKYYDQIDPIIRFTQKANINYDCLRAIAFEINNGETFSDAMKDLNIMDTDKVYYIATLTFTNGKRLYDFNVDVDMFNPEDSITCYFRESKGNTWFVTADLTPELLDFNVATGLFTADVKDIKLDFDEDDTYGSRLNYKEYTPQSITLRRVGVKKQHFEV